VKESHMMLYGIYSKIAKQKSPYFQGFEGLLAESKLNIELNILLTLFNKVEEGF